MRAMCACEDGGLLMFVFPQRELSPSLRRNIKINRTRGARRKPSNGAHIFHVDWRQRRAGDCQSSSCLFQSSPSWWPQARRRARIFEYAQFMVISEAAGNGKRFNTWQMCVGKYSRHLIRTRECGRTDVLALHNKSGSSIFWHFSERQMGSDRESRGEKLVRRRGVKCQSLAVRKCTKSHRFSAFERFWLGTTHVALSKIRSRYSQVDLRIIKY